MSEWLDILIDLGRVLFWAVIALLSLSVPLAAWKVYELITRGP